MDRLSIQCLHIQLADVVEERERRRTGSQVKCICTLSRSLDEPPLQVKCYAVPLVGDILRWILIQLLQIRIVPHERLP